MASDTLLGGGAHPVGADAPSLADEILFHADQKAGDASVRELWTADIVVRRR